MHRPGKAGSNRTFMVKCAPIKDMRGNNSSVMVSFRDVTRQEEKNDQLEGMLDLLKKSRDEVKRQNEALQILATRDPLTDCLNRRSFFEQYETVFRTALREGHRLACVMSDIDMFKQINDRYGHARGDEVISKVAETLRLSLRSRDSICRYGGEEFCIVLPDLTLSQAHALAERTRVIIEQLSIKGATDASAISITASFGVSTNEQHTQTLAELIDHADKALYRAKNSGRNRVSAWKPQPDADAKTLQGDFIPGISASAPCPEHPAAETGSHLPIDPDTRPGHDSLTGLPNRNQFHGHIVEAVQSCRGSQQYASVIMLDLDMFKRINNALGFAAGDQLLQIISRRLTSTLRSTDSVSRIDADLRIPSIYSLGGDEFGIILTGLDCTVFTAQVINRIIETVTEKVEIQDKEVYLTCSIGASVFPENGTDADTLLKNACTALYYAKLQGHNSYQFFDESLNRDESGNRDIASDLSRAVNQNALDLYYQPKIDLGTGRVNAVEALARWCHPGMGMIPPDEFLPVAEETGLMPQLGYWVIETACRRLRQWHHAGHEGITVSVNLSASQFHHMDLLETILCTLAANGLQPGHLELEITESTIMENIDAASTIIRSLHDAGIRISVDDFGTGYSSLNQLKRFPINTVKIDRSFIRDLTSDADDAAIVSAIIGTAHNMGMKIIAEGVETTAQLELLRNLQCDAMQGFLFSPPVPHNEALELLDQQLDTWPGAKKQDNIAV
jgi:diguanylate cyclase (GGDEF)-like protein